MKTITQAHLQAIVDRINRMTGSPMETYTKRGENITANIGNYHLDGAYGGVALHRMASEGGGIEDVFRVGHTSKRELANRMHAFIVGLEARQPVTA